jgi:hypothetical protein
MTAKLNLEVFGTFTDNGTYYTFKQRQKLKKIIALQEPYILVSKKNVYLHLCGSIMSHN